MYIEAIQYLSKKITVQLPKPFSHKVKRQSLLNTVVSDWHMKNNNNKLPPLTK